MQSGSLFDGASISGGSVTSPRGGQQPSNSGGSIVRRLKPEDDEIRFRQPFNSGGGTAVSQRCLGHQSGELSTLVVASPRLQLILSMHRDWRVVQSLVAMSSGLQW
jgi:hypothetical protein